MSTEPQSRISLDRPSYGLVNQFDLHLRVIADRYLGFFPRKEAYIDSLWKLHLKAKGVDTFLDARIEPNTSRAAWTEIRDNVEREAQARRAFLNTLTIDIINPLTALKETQDRTRKRIREDLKGSTAAHVEFAENILPKLKRAYIKKCQEFEDHRSAVVPPSNVNQAPIVPEGNTVLGTRSNPNLPSKSYVASPQPIRPLDRKPSSGGPRNRSPSGSTAFSDLAQHGKKQLNQLITLLDKEGGIRGSSRNADIALRSTRAKREAEEADKEYRKAVHWLETLRIRRVKILEGGYNSLERFILEGTDTVKKVLITYTDTLIATHTTQNYLATHIRSAVENVSAQTDTSLLAASLSNSLALSTPPPTLYYNYHVGECQDLIFGVSLADYATARGSENDAPRVIKICIDEIDKRGLDAEGLYRLQHKLERNEKAFSFNSFTDDIYSVASLLKLYLRELPEPLFRFPLQDRIQHSEDLDEHAANDFVVLRSKIRRLPGVHRASLKALVEHLSRVASRADGNKMDAKNLAIVFSPVVFGEDEILQGDLLSVQPMKDSVMEDLIENAHTLFDDRLLLSSPPLPPAPAGEPVPVITYGSSHTKITLPQGGEAHTADFTPELPVRPTGSIHPSTRGNPSMSPSRLCADLSAGTVPTQSITPPAVPLKIQVPTNTTGKPTLEPVAAVTTGEIERTPDQPQDFVPPPTVTSEQNQDKQHSAAESVPETPLTTSSLSSI
ncbi:hypothetical protein F5148DRAFT_1163734 [Russula earlei]|uniref:Uncharacterized protein n=1 Tax=Russula earlei TaxID=71964 RepID=A0ACC0UME5_9AGAM|nr:hypothetical protein F5148DRAFT_1163734 [Russula earlei]